MTPTELTTIIASGTAIGGLLVGWGITWGATKHTLGTLTKSVDALKGEFINHKDNREIHIDPKRDDKALNDLKDSISSHFFDVKKSLETLNFRCEKRGDDCGRHFSHLENRISAATGKPNGESGK